MPTVTAAALQRALGRVRLVDARAPERFCGEVEPLDSVAGHIPGALNRPFKSNLAADGRFKAREPLAREFAALLGHHAPAEVVHQCGSGVTACHNLLAMEAAGLAGSRLYPGSWSEWSADPARPVAVGA
jgi:thiosulfate/3-mercaptopyruvate sulfurtransferase